MPATAAAFPSWVLLEGFVFYREGDESFPDESKAPVRTFGTTSWGASFRIAFSLAEPPRISHLYAQLPGFPGPRERTPLHFLGTHHHLFLFCVGVQLPPHGDMNQDLFIYNSAGKPSCSLRYFPPCTEPHMDCTMASRDNGRLRCRAPPSDACWRSDRWPLAPLLHISCISADLAVDLEEHVGDGSGLAGGRRVAARDLTRLSREHRKRVFTSNGPAVGAGAGGGGAEAIGCGGTRIFGVGVGIGVSVGSGEL